MPSSAQDGSGAVGGVEAQEGSPPGDAAPQAFLLALGEWSPVGECAQAGASSLLEMPCGRVGGGAGAGVGSGASAASSGASEADSGTVAGDSGDAGDSPFLRHVSISLRDPGGGGHMSLAAGEAG